MSKLCLLLALVAILVGAIGCASTSESREFIPGKGWVPTN
jgi:hypothetical protein